ncbi:hypothetical protein [Hyphomicrobium sp.]|uniref:hypothetical protein n=1 Tax=Hyphomicrobium sp. TaxID=82 RepID=UPI003F7274B8
MSEKQPPGTTVTVSDTHHAPFIYVEQAPSCGNNGGIINVTLAAYRHIPGGSGKVATDLVVTAHMR